VSERARHRADLPPSTPITGLTTSIGSVVGDGAAVLGRGGMVLAVSSGLAAGVGLPAEASSTQASGGTPQTASVPLLTDTASSTALVAGADALASAPVSAPVKARVTFEHSAFSAQPTSTTAAPTPAIATRDVATISRSLARTVYLASRPAPARHAAPAATSSPSRSAPSSRPSSRPSSTPSTAPVPVLRSGRGATVIAIASRYLGIPYVYGGASPRGFDCSGLTQYVFAQLGVKLARSADGQYRTVPRVRASEAVPGDLVFYLSGGSAYHVGIYLGGHMMLAAPHSGTVVRKQAIYSSNIAYGRP
jgi:cell wall-associated NlpC family hydrolase